MNGIEKITQRIDQDAQSEIDKILGDARAQAAEILARYEAQAQKESEDIVARGEKNAAERQDRLASVARFPCPTRSMWPCWPTWPPGPPPPDGSS